MRLPPKSPGSRYSLPRASTHGSCSDDAKLVVNTTWTISPGPMT